MGTVKDRIGNVLAKNDKVLVELPTSSIMGFVAMMEEPGLVAQTPGRIVISCAIALPVDAQYGAVAQLVKVYDPDHHGTLEATTPQSGTSGPSHAN